MSLKRKLQRIVRGVAGLKLRAQRRFDLIKPMVPSAANVTEIGASDFRHTFFGYYDRSPWNEDETKLLALCTDSKSYPDENAPATVHSYCLKEQTFTPIATTTAWNFQQASQQQWMADDLVILNELDAGRPCSGVYDLLGQQQRKFDFHVGMIHRSARKGISYDYLSILQREIDYGYPGLTQRPEYAAENCLAVFDTDTGAIERTLSWNQLHKALARDSSFNEQAFRWIQHAKFNEAGNRMFFVMRTRDDDGSDWNLKVGSDLWIWDLESDRLDLALRASDWKKGGNHPVWYDDDQILMNLREKPGAAMRLTLFSKYSEGYKILAPRVDGTGHPTRIPNSQLIVTDSYFFDRVQRIHLIDPSQNSDRKDLVRFRYNASLKGPNRCDLHPRVDSNGNRICFDSTQSGDRRLYLMNLNRS